LTASNKRRDPSPEVGRRPRRRVGASPKRERLNAKAPRRSGEPMGKRLLQKGKRVGGDEEQKTNQNIDHRRN